MHFYDEKNFYSTDRLIQFGMGTNVAQQMVESMNQAIQNMHIPGAGNAMRQPQAPEHIKRLEEALPVPGFEPVFYAMIEGKQEGPYCETELVRLINEKKVKKETYVWHTGLEEWKTAENVPAVLRLVALTPPPPPPASLLPPTSSVPPPLAGE